VLVIWFTVPVMEFLGAGSLAQFVPISKNSIVLVPKILCEAWRHGFLSIAVVRMITYQGHRYTSIFVRLSPSIWQFLFFQSIRSCLTMSEVFTSISLILEAIHQWVVLGDVRIHAMHVRTLSARRNFQVPALLREVFSSTWFGGVSLRLRKMTFLPCSMNFWHPLVERRRITWRYSRTERCVTNSQKNHQHKFFDT